MHILSGGMLYVSKYGSLFARGQIAACCIGVTCSSAEDPCFLPEDSALDDSTSSTGTGLYIRGPRLAYISISILYVQDFTHVNFNPALLGQILVVEDACLP